MAFKKCAKVAGVAASLGGGVSAATKKTNTATHVWSGSEKADPAVALQSQDQNLGRGCCFLDKVVWPDCVDDGVCGFKCNGREEDACRNAASWKAGNFCKWGWVRDGGPDEECAMTTTSTPYPVPHLNLY
ncbi:unnamed protein product [Amoebophrya sp. A120]|nr:unnamed protein product [Amoebophrya sp. A120]|eukprot:GSA120T00014854001.1